MSEMKLFEQIEDYLLDRLSPEARLDFEAQMAADAALRNEVSLHRDMMSALENEDEVLFKSPPDKDVLDLRELMENAYEAYQGEKKEEDSPDLPNPPSSGSWKRFIIAALAMLVIAIGVWWTQQDNVAPEANIPATSVDSIQPGTQRPNIADSTEVISTPNTNTKPVQKQPDYAAVVRDVYAASPYAPGVLMSDQGDEPQETPLQLAAKAYTKNQFNEVLTLLKTLPDDGRTDALKLRAHAFLQLNRFDQAAIDFETLTKSASYKKDAEWYLLLCHAARLPKNQSAYDALLAKVAAPGHPFEQKALELKKLMAERIR